MARSAIKSTKREVKPPSRFDGELYARPWPNPFSENWRDGFAAGYEIEPVKSPSDREWRDGYYTGLLQRDYDKEEMDRVGSSNT